MGCQVVAEGAESRRRPGRVPTLSMWSGGPSGLRQRELQGPSVCFSLPLLTQRHSKNRNNGHCVPKTPWGTYGVYL